MRPSRDLDVARQSRVQIATRAIIDDRIRRVSAILVGMTAVAGAVIMVTTMIHDRGQ
jgi:hypothetical protein